jgi:hypothetical protein
MPPCLKTTVPLIPKEANMLYKTMILHLLEDRPALYEQLRQTRTLRPTLNRLASGLKARHEAWKTQLAATRPDSDPSQISSEALELALKELVDSLPSASAPDEDDLLSLNAAMAFLHRHTPPA